MAPCRPAPRSASTPPFRKTSRANITSASLTPMPTAPRSATTSAARRTRRARPATTRASLPWRTRSPPRSKMRRSITPTSPRNSRNTISSPSPAPSATCTPPKNSGRTRAAACACAARRSRRSRPGSENYPSPACGGGEGGGLCSCDACASGERLPPLASLRSPPPPRAGEGTRRLIGLRPQFGVVSHQQAYKTRGRTAMKIPRRSVLRLAGGAVALPAVARLARAQSYPSRSVLILVGYAAGGPTDICARLIAEALSKTLGQQFVVENRDGAGSNIATEAAIHADPDGYTLLLVTSSNAINATLYPHLNFNYLARMVPIAGIMVAPSVLEVTPSFPVNSTTEFIAYAKANPGKIDLGTAGNGSPPHMFAELFMAMTGVKLNVVGYRGGGPALIDLLGGPCRG